MENPIKKLSDSMESAGKTPEGLHSPMSEETRSRVLLMVNETVKNPDASLADVHSLIKEIMQGTMEENSEAAE